MISRYSRKELVKIWSEENKYKIWLDVEIAAAQAMEKYKTIPKGVSAIVKRKGKIRVKRIHDIEAKVKHDVIAFLTSITEQAGVKARHHENRLRPNQNKISQLLILSLPGSGIRLHKLYVNFLRGTLE